MKDSDKRMAILEAARRVVAEKGYMRATVEDIAHEAGVAKGTVYLYFKDKPDIMIGMAERALDVALKMVRDAATHPLSPEEKLRELFTGWSRFVLDHPGVLPFTSPEAATVASREMERFKQAIHPRMREMIDDLAGIIRDGVEAGSFRKVNPHMAAVMFVHSFPAIFTAAHQHLPVENPAQAALDIFFNGLAAPPRSGKETQV